MKAYESGTQRLLKACDRLPMIIDVNGNISDGGMLDFWLDNGSQGNIADLRELDEYFHIIYYTNDTEKGDDSEGGADEKVVFATGVLPLPPNTSVAMSLLTDSNKIKIAYIKAERDSNRSTVPNPVAQRLSKTSKSGKRRRINGTIVIFPFSDFEYRCQPED